MDMELRHHVADRRHIELVAGRDALERRATRAISVVKPRLVRLGEVDDLGCPGAARHQQDPGKIRVVDGEHARRGRSPTGVASFSSCDAATRVGRQ